MRIFLFALLLFFVAPAYADGYLVSITSSEPPALTVCGQPQTFTIDIDNPSPFLLSNVSLVVTMPSGVTYISGSITGGSDQNISNLSAPVFSLLDIATLTHVSITFKAVVNCEVMSYIAGGNLIQNHIQLNYTGNGTNSFDQLTTGTYLIRQPNLSITNVTNQSYTGNIGDNFTRCVTILNSGMGELSQFTFKDTHGAGIIITGVDKGGLVNTGNVETITLSGTDFNSIGDGDNLFELNESITICESVHIQNCVGTSSDFITYWGCNGKDCQLNTSSANVVFPNLQPNVIVTANNGDINNPTNSCLGPGIATQQKLEVTNTGSGQAVNVQLDIFEGYSNFYYNFIGTGIDPASFMIQYGAGAPQPIVEDSSMAAGNYSCLPGGTKSRVWITIPVLNPGETVIITWNTYSCCSDLCAGVGYNIINSWQVQGTYENICETNYLIDPLVGHTYNSIGGNLQDDNSPTNIGNGQTATFGFEMLGYGNSYATGPGAHWKIEFTIPPCLSYGGNLHVTSSDGTQQWNPTTINVSGDTVASDFVGMPPFSLDHAHFSLDLSMDCAGCGGGTGAVSIKVIFVPDATCGCEIPLSCQSVNVDMKCPQSCAEGLQFTFFDIKRTNFGLPDNDNNGLPDVTGVIDTARIRTNRAMFGDTITCHLKGKVTTSGTHPSWNYCYVNQSLNYGKLLSYLDGSLRIYQASTGTIYTCNNFTPTVTTAGNSSDFFYDLSTSVLIAKGCVPAGFVFSSNDTIEFIPRYKVTTNGTGVVPCKSFNSFYMSSIANPTNGSDKYQCGTYDDIINIITYYYALSGPDALTVTGCNQVQVNEYYYMSVGPCCGNYAGGNIFPYEYRNWAHIKNFGAVVPHGYKFISAYFSESSTGGNNVAVAGPVINIIPVNANSDTLNFYLEQYTQPAGGPLPYSDDGFHGYIVMTLEPTCEVTPFVDSPITWIAEFDQVSNLDSSKTVSILSVPDDKITFNAPDLFLQSLLPSVVAPNKIVSWDIMLTNTTAIDAHNVWLSAPSISGVKVIKVLDVENNVYVPDSSSIYQAGILPANKVRNFKVFATFSSCLQDSIVLYTGWNCSKPGYPKSVSDYPCTPDSIVLKLTPQVASILPTITSPSGSINLCDTAYYTVNGLNIQLGTAYDLQLQVTLPLGVSIVSGTSEMSYPVANPFTSISDPVFLGGTMWMYDIHNLDSLIDTNGLKGVLEPALNGVTITFAVVTDCNYTSGSNIGFNFLGHSACGSPIDKEVILSTDLGITGVLEPYLTDVKLKTTYLSPCANASMMTVTVINRGPLTTNSTDTIKVQLPKGVSYVTNSVAGVHNPPGSLTPYLYSLNNSQYLAWSMPAGVAVGDSIKFTFQYYGTDSVLQCNITKFYANTTSTGNAVCAKSGSGCNINVITGDTMIPVFTYKAYLTLANGSSTSVPDPPSGELVTLNMDILNTGEAILPGHKSAIHFYYDSNNNGIYNNSDVYIESDSLAIGNNTTIGYNHTMGIPTGKACAILAVIDTGYNSCICNGTQLLFKIRLLAAGNDKTICSNDTITIGYDPVNTYAYSWTQISGAASLSSATVSNPEVTGVNTGSVNDTLKYVVSVQRGSCNSNDTVNVIVAPKPIVNAGADTAVCSGLSVSLVASGGAMYTWSPALSLNTNNNDSVIATPAAPTMYTVTIADVNGGCKSMDSVYVNVHVNPIVNAGKDTLLCAGKNITLTATALGGQQPYTYSWNTTYNGNALSITPTTDTIFYAGVTDVYGCKSANDSIKIALIKPLQIDVAPYLSICEGDSVKLMASASGGSIPYTYQWMPGSYSSQTITVYPVSTTYYTITVTDACALLPVKDTIPVIVNPLPVPTFSVNDTDGCAPLCVIFTNTSIANVMNWSWSFGNGNSSSAKDTSICFANPGQYAVALTATTDTGCKATLSYKDMITVHAAPHVNFNYTPEVTTLNNASISFSDSSSTATFWNWNFGDPKDTTGSFVQSPSHVYHDTGTYCITLIAASIYNCADTATHCVDVNPETTLYIPNAFSPNSDGLNEEFYVAGAFIKDVEMYIYDRWGNLIYEGHGVQPKWNGKVEGSAEPVQQDVFVYYILVTDYYGKEKEFLGHVTVVK